MTRAAASALVLAVLTVSGCASSRTSTSSSSSGATAAAARQLRVDRVVDGDTVWGTDHHGHVVKIRLALVDAPEASTTRYGHAECGGPEAHRALRRLVNGRTVQLRRTGGEGEDRYGRQVAELVVRGRSVDEQLVRAGWAKPYRVPATAGGAAANRRITRAASDARRRHAGVWALCGRFGRSD